MTAPERQRTDALPVLVVDDDSALIRTLSDILRMNGYSPYAAATGREGLEIAGRNAPALAVVDLRLPDMDGMELVRRLHELSAMTEVVVLTGNASVESAIAALREQSVDYLLKPVQVERLLHVATVATERWQRRMAEERLRESDDRFRRVVSSDMLGIFFWDAAGRVYDANARALALFGADSAELHAGLLRRDELVVHDEASVFDEMLAEAHGEGFAPARETSVRRRDGSAFPALIGASSLRGSRGGGVGFVLDITERKQAEIALVARARQQAAVAQLGRRAIGIRDLDALFAAACTAVATTLELPFVALLELAPSGSALALRAGEGWPPDATGFRLDLVTEDTQSGHTLKHGGPTVLHDLTREKRFEGARVLHEFGIRSGVTVPIPGIGDRPYGVVAAHDTQRREFSVDDLHFMEAVAHILGAAVARVQGEARSRQAQRLEAVGRLAGGIAHDFNNILAAIIGYSEAVQASLPDTAPSHADIDEILKASERGAGLTRQLLAFSRRQVLTPKPLDLNASVRGMHGMLHQLIGKQVELRLLLDEALAEVRADPSQMEQVIMNLCVNARDAMPQGGVLTIATRNLTVGATPEDELPTLSPGAYAVLSVTDTGVGMDAETRSRIFEPFFTTKAADKGTGLGLATVYGIVQQSGGELSVQSELGHGSTFTMLLPASRS